ncbi:cellular tumor antigen p53 [Ceratina calcarata]|uniref:Cellular tumor antigen p53 n=1 Tax=Ceratina calcarata TaxID=156304 RepID=A0AAJ7NF86_9HYME|nr:cellular tumor antigen p53 [Ceratina calcarata]
MSTLIFSLFLLPDCHLLLLHRTSDLIRSYIFILKFLNNTRRTMSSTNGYIDSQESDILPEEEYNMLIKHMELSSSFCTNTLFQMEEDKMEEKYDLTQQFIEDKQIKDEVEEQYYHGSDSVIPVKEEFAGVYNFQVCLGNQDSSKHWVYSQPLKKVFINMEQTLPLRFKWQPPDDRFFLRTAMVFSLDQYASDPVRRCHNHMAPTYAFNREIDPRVIKHVVRCTDQLSVYEERNEHLSIVTPLNRPQPGSEYVPLYFKFLCKNSCPSGMNRRPTELIFTLEDRNKQVLGRRRLPVRVCSCPKRDKKKEEDELPNSQPELKKKKVCIPQESLYAKKMMPSCDTHVYNVQLSIVGKENYLAVLKYAYDIMAGQASRTGQFEFFKPYMDDILHKTP